MLVGGVVKIVVNYNVVAIPSINITAPRWAMCWLRLVCVMDLVSSPASSPGGPGIGRCS